MAVANFGKRQNWRAETGVFEQAQVIRCNRLPKLAIGFPCAKTRVSLFTLIVCSLRAFVDYYKIYYKIFIG